MLDRGTRARRAVALLLSAGLLAGCTAGGEADDATGSPSPTPSEIEVDSRTLGQGEDEAAEQEDVAELEDEGIEVDEGNGGPSGPFDVEAFCAAVAPVEQVAATEGGGSDEHVAALDAVVGTAPAEAYDAIVQLREHYEFAVDPADPTTQDPEAFPPHVSTALSTYEAAVAEHCS